MMLSVVIPARDEEQCIASTVKDLHAYLTHRNIKHEIVVVNDGSTDGTKQILLDLQKEISTLVAVDNLSPNGFGFAVRKGLESFNGEVVAIYMADASDSPEDLEKFYNVLQEKSVDCVFGSRFSKDSKIVDYPRLKLILNRMANLFIQMLFGLRYNDVTNAFKMYRRHVIEGLKPFLSHHFNITVELPLKSITRGYSYAVVANDWHNRKEGESKLKIREMGSRYLFIVLYCFIEKLLVKSDYHRAKNKNVEETLQGD